MSGIPVLVGLDWGTSSLRAYLLDPEGQVIERRTEPWGIMQLPPRGFRQAFDEVTGKWRRIWPALPVIASGMVGSAQGWHHAPSCRCPAGTADLAAALTSMDSSRLHIVPGVLADGDRPDAMRGEETQIAGALRLHPELGAKAIFILPGTHSKWVHVAEGRIRAFNTYITGELFFLLRQHSTLGRFARETQSAPNTQSAQVAFMRGVRDANAAEQGIAPLLFATRALVLAERIPPEASLEYLSGLLIGDELRGGLREVAGGGIEHLILLGECALCARYAAALRIMGIQPPRVLDETAPAGLWRIAQAAGLVRE